MGKLVKFVVGILLLALGITLLIKSNIGAGSFDALHANIVYGFSFFTIGSWVYITAFILVVINYIITHEFQYKTFFTSVFVGFLVDMWFSILGNYMNEASLYLQILIFISGIISLSLGVTLNIKSGYPTSPYELIPLTLSNKYSIPYWKTKLFVELFVVSLGILVGLTAGIGFGQVGIGTLVISISIGPVINMLLKIFK